MLEKFYPDSWVDSTYEIDYEYYYRMGYRGIIYDIDNTLVPHGADADDKAIALFKRLKSIGFDTMLLSNNKEERVKRFNKHIHSKYIFKANKPFEKGYKEAMRLMGTTSDNTLFIGDQLFTDVWGAKRLGIYCILSKPINPKEEIQIVLKRRLEKPVLKSYTKQDNVILIGFMGAGKTTIGEKLASRMNRRMIDTDAYIVAKEGMSINDIFATKGEEYFRELETNVIKELTKTTHNAIISTGGGMPLREENAKLLRKLGKVFYLKSEPGTVYERVKDSTDRPLLNVENPMERIVSLLNERNPKYKKASHVTIETDDKSVDEVVDFINKSK